VADELPDSFLDALFACARHAKDDCYILGEVWEDASAKFSHGGRRRFLLGQQMHSVMNYPLAEAILHFVTEGTAEQLAETLLNQQEHYPPFAIHGLMNHIGTHDTIRALTKLGGMQDVGRKNIHLSQSQYDTAVQRLKLCAALQFTLPGNPCVYYGDEAGLQGGMDPFNRGCYPWGEEDRNLLDYYQSLGALRRSLSAFAGGGFTLVSASMGCIAYLRHGAPDVLVLANANPHAITYDYRGATIPVAAMSAVIQTQ
jgi:glycosidase